MSLMTTGVKRYLVTLTLFILAMAVKIYTDQPHWNGTVVSYLASTLIIIPIVWYAGYFWRQAEDEYDKPQ